MRIKSIALNTTSAYQFYQLARTATMILISIILVKAGFGRSEVSSFELFLFIANLLSFFWIMGIKNAALSYFHNLNESTKKAFFPSVFILLQAAGILFALLFLGLLPYIQLDDALIADRRSAFLLALYLFFYAPTVLIDVLFILREESKKLIRYAIFIHIIPLLLFIPAAFHYQQMMLLFYILCGWAFLKWIYLIYLLIRTGNIRAKRQVSKQFFLFSIPLILHILLGNGMEFIDGILVNRFFEQDQFAIYRYGARELPFILILISAMSSTQIPLAVKNMQHSAASIKSGSRRLMHLFYPASILLLFLSPFLFEFFYSEEFRISALYFNIYLLILASRIILSEVFIYATKQNKLLMYVSGAELVLNIVLSLVLMRYFGLAGISFATVLAFMISKLYLLWVIWKKNGIHPSHYLDLKYYAMYTLALYLAFGLSLYLFSGQ